MENKQDLEVPPTYLQPTLRLMELFQMDMKEAYLYLKSMGHHLDNAIAMKLDPQTATAPPHPLTYQFSSDSQEDSYKPHRANVSRQRGNPRQAKMDEYVQKKSYNKTYLIKKARSSRSKTSKRKKDQTDQNQKMEQEFDFVGALSKLIEGEVNVSFLPDIYDTFKNLWDERKLVAIHCIKFVNKADLKPPFDQMLQFTKEIYRNAYFVETFNKYLINYGIDPSHFDFNHYPFMKELVEERDQYNIIVLRYNDIVGKVQLVAKLPFSKSFSLSQPHLFSELITKLQRTTNYQKSASQSLSKRQQKQLEEDRKLRQQQQDEYFKQMEAVEDKIQKTVGTLEKVEKIDIAEMRKRNREQLPTYSEDIPNSISFKVRLPNSQFIYFKLPRTENADYIFKSVENLEGEIGFVNDNDRKFDILVPLERICLLDRRSHTFESIFGQSEMESLVVKEL